MLNVKTVSYTHLRAHETKANLVCRLLLEKKNLSVWRLFVSSFFFLMIRRPPRSTRVRSSAASDVYKRQADITSLVNFSLLNEFFSKKKINVKRVVTQKFFLERMGIIERAKILEKKMNEKQKKYMITTLSRLCLLYTSPSPRD